MSLQQKYIIDFFFKERKKFRNTKQSNFGAATTSSKLQKFLFHTTEHSRATAPVFETQSVLSGKRASAQQF